MSIHNIIVTGRLYRELEPFLRQRHDKSFRFIAESEVTPSDYEWADAFVGFRPAAHFRLDGLQWVHALGAGVDAFVQHHEWKPGVILTRTIGAFGRQISEYCLSYLLADAQQHSVFRAQQQAKSWLPVAPRPLAGRRVVVFGTGSIGQEIARQLTQFGMLVVGVSRSGLDKPQFEQTVALSDCGEPLQTADWVINTLPLTQETNRLFDGNYFAKMNGCGFINVGRGGSVCADALLRALEQSKIRLAVLDVFEEEPLEASSELWAHPGVIVTPHISAITEPEVAARDFVKVLQGMEHGRVPQEHLVDPGQGY